MTPQEVINEILTHIDSLELNEARNALLDKTDGDAGYVNALEDVKSFIEEHFQNPSEDNFDEAARAYVADGKIYNWKDMENAFKAGPYWTVDQGVTKECTVESAIPCNIPGESIFTVRDLSWMEKEFDTVSGDTVIVQIRKK